MTYQFFLPMVVPTVTAQEKQLGVTRAGKAYIYDSPDVKAARQKFTAALVDALHSHGPEEKLTCGVRLTTRWCYPIRDGSGHRDGEYKITKPDTDNTIKLFKDCMTRAGFWKDDALVCSELTEKFWSDVPGVYVKIETIGGE
jgi:Holliday junction resolvase RusA-like endonuclease